MKIIVELDRNKEFESDTIWF